MVQACSQQRANGKNPSIWAWHVFLSGSEYFGDWMQGMFSCAHITLLLTISSFRLKQLEKNLGECWKGIGRYCVWKVTTIALNVAAYSFEFLLSRNWHYLGPVIRRTLYYTTTCWRNVRNCLLNNKQSRSTNLGDLQRHHYHRVISRVQMFIPVPLFLMKLVDIAAFNFKSTVSSSSYTASFQSSRFSNAGWVVTVIVWHFFGK